MWAGIVYDCLVGPYVLPSRLTASHYLEFLNNMLEEQLDVKMPLSERVHMWYLHEGERPHFTRPVTQWLNNQSVGTAQ